MQEPGSELQPLVLPSLLQPRPGPQRGQEWNQWAARLGDYLTGTLCHWLTPAPERAVAMTAWAGVEALQRCQEEAPHFSPGIPIHPHGTLLEPQEESRATAGTRAPLTTPTIPLQQPLLPLCARRTCHEATPCHDTGTCRQPGAHNHTGQRWALHRQICALEALP